MERTDLDGFCIAINSSTVLVVLEGFSCISVETVGSHSHADVQ